MIASTAPVPASNPHPGFHPNQRPDPGFDRLELVRFLLLVGLLGGTMHFALRAAVHVVRDLTQLVPLVSRLLDNLA